MCQRFDNLWPEVVSFQNLLLAFRRAARGKRSKAEVAAFEFDLEPGLFSLQEELKQGFYLPGAYRSFYVHDPKKRLISAAPFKDRVIHHALCNIIEPIFERKFIYNTYANRKGKGTHRALDRCTSYLRRFDYCLPMDVRQFFPSIDHQVLLEILSQTIADDRVLDLCGRILASGQGVLANEYDMVYFPGDDLLAAARPRGLPIGNLTSQFWANVYLNGFDHFVKRTLKCRGYIRYVDDVLLFANEKPTLHAWRKEAIDYLSDLRLTVHENSAQPHPCQAGIPFLGFQVFRDHRRLKRQKAVNARRRLKKLLLDYQQGRVKLSRIQAGIQGWINHARYGNTWGLRRAVLRDIVL